MMRPIDALNIGGYVAPILRNAKGAKVKVVDKDGNVVRETTSVEVLRKLTEAAGLELTGDSLCAGWDGPCTKGKNGRPKEAPERAIRLSSIAERNGEPWRCRSCGSRMGLSSLTPEQLSERGRKGWRGLTPEQHSEIARKVNAKLTPEQLSERGRVGNAALTTEQRLMAARAMQAALTPERRRDGALKANAARTPEERSESARKWNALLTPEQRSEALRKAWKKRKAT